MLALPAEPLQRPAEHGRAAPLAGARGQHVGVLRQGRVIALRRERRERLQLAAERGPASPHRPRRPPPLVPRLLEPEAQGRDADTEAPRDLGAAAAVALAGQQGALAQIGRVGPRHGSLRKAHRTPSARGRSLRTFPQSALAPNRLELEVTESVLLQDNDATLGLLHRLRGLGVSIAMDDFGTGYSSLSYLRSFPSDKIKVDQSFVRDLAGEQGSVEIVRAVVGLGKALGMGVLAEGVETEEQLGVLQAEGCDELQRLPVQRAAAVAGRAGDHRRPPGVEKRSGARPRAGHRRRRRRPGRRLKGARQTPRVPGPTPAWTRDGRADDSRAGLRRAGRRTGATASTLTPAPTRAKAATRRCGGSGARRRSWRARRRGSARDRAHWA